MNLKGKFIALFILSVIILFTWLLIHDKSKKTYIYSDFGVDVPADFQALGIDVSHYQGEINWNEVSNMKINGDSLSFVYIKCTEGTALVDDMYKINAQGAERANLRYGFYHFFRSELSAKKQAEFFAEKCLTENDSLRPVIDIEIRTTAPKEKVRDSVYAFLQTFERYTKVRPMIYTNETFYTDYFLDSFLQNELYWIANYNGKCGVLNSEHVLIWQFTEKSTINGISEKVDMNVAKPEFWKRVVIK